jgi:hypothetical protein
MFQDCNIFAYFADNKNVLKENYSNHILHATKHASDVDT